MAGQTRKNYGGKRKTRQGSGKTRGAKAAYYMGEGVKWGNTAMQALKLAQKVAGMINVEYGRKEKAISMNVGTTPILMCLTNVAQGDGNNARDGNSVKAKSLDLKMLITKQAAGATSCGVRLVVFMDRVGNGTTPGCAEVLSEDIACGIFSPLNADHVGRFQVLASEFFALAQGSAINKSIRIFRNLDHHLKYKGTGSGVADTATGHIWLLAVSDEVTAPPVLGGISMIKWVDN